MCKYALVFLLFLINFYHGKKRCQKNHVSIFLINMLVHIWFWMYRDDGILACMVLSFS